MKNEDLFWRYEKEVAEFKLQLVRKLTGESLDKELTPKRTSKISMIEAVLKIAGKPLHVKDIIEAVQKKFGVELERDSISSALTKKSQKKVCFERTGPNIFGLRQG